MLLANLIAWLTSLVIASKYLGASADRLDISFHRFVAITMISFADRCSDGLLKNQRGC